MSDWGGEQISGVRLSPADHYDQGVQVLQGMTPSDDPGLYVIGQALLGLLRERMERS